MQDSRGKAGKRDREVEVEVEGLPVVWPNVAGIDLGSETHWVCAWSGWNWTRGGAVRRDDTGAGKNGGVT
jgi:hypothetical protein